MTNLLPHRRHTSISAKQSGITDAIRQSAATGLQVHLSELDIAVNPGKTANFSLTDALLQKQKDLYTFIVRTYRQEVPKAQQHGITTWNVGDKDSWIPGYCKCTNFPLPFDTQYAKKPAYRGILDGLQ